MFKIEQEYDQNESQTIDSDLDLDCLSPQEFNTSSDFYYCFRTLFNEELRFSIFLVLLVVFTVILNILVIVLLIRKRSRMTIFDKLIISLCFCDALTGLLDAPFYSIVQIFGFWPFNYTSGIIWLCFDSGICTVNMMSMLYMTYVRLRSLQAPNTFEREVLIKRPFIIAIIYWILGNLILIYELF